MYCFTNGKGGSGCTAACISVAAWVAKYMEYNVVIADLDRQGDSVKSLDVPSSPNAMLYLSGAMKLEEAVIKTSRPNLSILPGDNTISAFNGSLTTQKNMYGDAYPQIAKGVIERLVDLSDAYDYAFVDTAKSGELQVLSIRAASHVIIPTMLDYNSLSNTLGMIEATKELMRFVSISIIPFGAVGHDGQPIKSKMKLLDGLRAETSGTPGIGIFDGVPMANEATLLGHKNKTIWEKNPDGPIGSAYNRICKSIFLGE